MAQRKQVRPIEMVSKLIIGIVNWNTKDLLEQCLLSIKNQKTDFSFTTVVVDNASSDRSATVVKKHKALLIQNKENSGMAAGLNQIIKKYPAEYYLFLHPDTKLGVGVLQKMISYLDAYLEVGVAGLHLVYPNGKNFASAHRFPRLRALFFEAFSLSHGVYLRDMDYSKEQDADIIASACFFVRKKCFDYGGLFDERFTNWMAEWDLCKRLKDGQWKVRYVPVAQVVHYEGQADTSLEYKKYSYVIADKMLGSLFLFYRKHYSWLSLVALKWATAGGLSAKVLLYAPFVFTSKEARERVWPYIRTMGKILFL